MLHTEEFTKLTNVIQWSVKKLEIQLLWLAMKLLRVSMRAHPQWQGLVRDLILFFGQSITGFIAVITTKIYLEIRSGGGGVYKCYVTIVLILTDTSLRGL